MASLGIGSGGTQRQERHSFCEASTVLMELLTKAHESCMAEESSQQIVLITMRLHGNWLSPRVVAQGSSTA